MIVRLITVPLASCLSLLTVASSALPAAEWVLRHELHAEGLVAREGYPSSFGTHGATLDGRTAVVGNRNDDGAIGAAYVFDIAAGKQVWRLTPEQQSRNWFGGIGINLSGKTAVIPAGLVNEGQPSFFLFDVETGEQEREFFPHDFGLDDFWIDYAVDGDVLAFNSGFAQPEHPLHVIDLRSDEELLSLPNADDIDINNGRLIVANEDANSAKVIDLETTLTLHTLTPALGQLPPHQSVALSASYAAIQAYEGTFLDRGAHAIDVFDLKSGDLVRSIEIGDLAGDFAIDGNYIVQQFSENIATFPERIDRQSAVVYDLTTGEEVFRFPSLFARGSSVDISGNTAIFSTPTPARDGGILYVATLTGLPGDFDSNGFFDSLDLDLLSEQIRIGSNDPEFDLNSDGIISGSDRVLWIHDLKKTYFGDANLDGEFNSGDLVAVFVAGEYEDAIDSNSTWATGDWNGDGDFTTRDLVAAFQDGGYEQGLRVASHAVPEPSGLAIFLAGLLVLRTTWGKGEHR